MKNAIVTTIWNQISMGVKMRIGAREPIACNHNELRCKVLNGRYWVLVRLMGDDTYTIRIITQKPAPTFAVVELAKVEDIYCENLSQVIADICNISVD